MFSKRVNGKSQVKEVRLDETLVRQLDIAKDGSVPLTVGKGKIYTLGVEF